ncbi:hypothetical protein QUF80_23765 [Desulfococcaceae bacterium HSG8]|nr:hypothetical protein [Desulfococcaceae bacterium HSG8]
MPVVRGQLQQLTNLWEKKYHEKHHHASRITFHASRYDLRPGSAYFRMCLRYSFRT